jgi:hypothetical protein
MNVECVYEGAQAKTVTHPLQQNIPTVMLKYFTQTIMVAMRREMYRMIEEVLCLTKVQVQTTARMMNEAVRRIVL